MFDCFFKRWHIIPPGGVWLAVTRKSASTVITRRHCPPRCMLDRSVYQTTQWTVANLAHLSVIEVDTPTCDVRRGWFSKRLVTANHTHTWWYDTSPLKGVTDCDVLQQAVPEARTTDTKCHLPICLFPQPGNNSKASDPDGEYTRRTSDTYSGAHPSSVLNTNKSF